MGTILVTVYSQVNITQILSMPIWQYFPQQLELIQISPEWSVRKIGRGIKYVHHCPCGDFRVLAGKVCHLCQAQVPDGVEFLSRVLSEGSS